MNNKKAIFLILISLKIFHANCQKTNYFNTCGFGGLKIGDTLTEPTNIASFEHLVAPKLLGYTKEGLTYYYVKNFVVQELSSVLIDKIIFAIDTFKTVQYISIVASGDISKLGSSMDSMYVKGEFSSNSTFGGNEISVLFFWSDMSHKNSILFTKYFSNQTNKCKIQFFPVSSSFKGGLLYLSLLDELQLL
jgi:hypothetical protein